LFASPDEVHNAQLAAIRYANATVEASTTNADAQRALIVANERELRERAALRSAVLWAVIGLPFLIGVVYAAVYLLLAWRLAAASAPAFP
jgi:hypothetical protein